MRLSEDDLTVAIVTHNRAHRLAGTLQAMMDQTVSGFRVLVCDDASTDETASVVARFRTAGVEYHRNPRNVGLYANWNVALRLTGSQYLSIFHDHDIYYPTIVEKLWGALHGCEDVVFAYTAVDLIDHKGKRLGVIAPKEPPYRTGLAFARRYSTRFSSEVIAACTMVRRSAYDRVGDYDTDVGPAGDLTMWVRLARLGGCVGYVKQPQAAIRYRPPTLVADLLVSELHGLLALQRRNLDSVYGPTGLLRWAAGQRHAVAARKYLLRRGLRYMLDVDRGSFDRFLSFLDEEGFPGTKRLLRAVRHQGTAQALRTLRHVRRKLFGGYVSLDTRLTDG